MIDNKQVTYFHRNSKSGFSIGRVFFTIIKEVKKSIDVLEYNVPSHRALPWSILQNIYFVFRKRNKKGVNHITGDIHYCIFALIGCKSVLTIHDLVVVDKRHNALKRFIKWLIWIYLPVKLADEIVCISDKTKKELLTYVRKKNIKVIYNPIDNIFQTTLREFCIPPRILHIGCGWNKNLVNVIKALQSIECHLRIVGKIQEHQLLLLQEFNINYSNVSNLSDEAILEEYQCCDIVSFPSIYEGFGMPIIEGQKTGRAILTSRIEPLSEIARDGACFVDPYSVKMIKEGFQKIILNEDYRINLIKKGITNVQRFNVTKIASQYINIYNK